MNEAEFAKRARAQNRRLLRDVAALKSYVDDGWPVWRIAERHVLKPAEVRRALASAGIGVPSE